VGIKESAMRPTEDEIYQAYDDGWDSISMLVDKAYDRGLQDGRTYTHRNGERILPEVEGWYWVVNENGDVLGICNTYSVIWQDGSVHWYFEEAEFEAPTGGYYGPIPMPKGNPT
jgi:hypothetical protein